MSIEELLPQAMALSPQERADLAALLLESIDEDQGDDDALDAVIERRMSEVETKRVIPVPWEAARKRIFQRDLPRSQD